VAYPLCDLVLILCLLLLSVRSGDPALRHAMRILSLALTIIVITDSTFDYLTLQNAYATGGLLDVGWPLGYGLLGLGARAVRFGTAEQAARSETAGNHAPANDTTAGVPKVWRLLLPYALVPTVGALLIYTWQTSADVALKRGVYTGAALLIGLIMVRQILAILENAQLYRRLSAATQLEMDHLLRDAMTDGLTGLGNHRAFQETLAAAVAAAPEDGAPISLVLVDVDDFKSINDCHGHKHGDRVLVAAGALLGRTYDADQAFRIGGDEFALLLPRTTLVRAVAAMERRQIDGVASLYGATLSIGIAAGVGGVVDADMLREEADAALCEAKRRGRNQMVTFEEIQATTSIMSAAKIRAVRRLLEDDVMGIAFQPIWDLERNTVLAFEALARPNPRLGLDGPGEVFVIAEKLGRAHELDALCRREILARAMELPAEVLVFINVIPQSLEQDSGIALKFARAVKAAGLKPERVVIEITERAISRLDTVVRGAAALRAVGFRIALDDVGSGNSGLEMLRRLPVDFVKIDQSVVRAAATEIAARSVLAAIIAFARETGVYVIAEGIETDAMLAFVRHVGTVTMSMQGGQGYLLGRPTEALGDVGSGALALAACGRE
jgi:diguanylate cyclase (GGDEF)-like protein